MGTGIGIVLGIVIVLVGGFLLLRHSVKKIAENPNTPGAIDALLKTPGGKEALAELKKSNMAIAQRAYARNYY